MCNNRVCRLETGFACSTDDSTEDSTEDSTDDSTDDIAVDGTERVPTMALTLALAHELLCGVQVQQFAAIFQSFP